MLAAPLVAGVTWLLARNSRCAAISTDMAGRKESKRPEQVNASDPSTLSEGEFREAHERDAGRPVADGNRIIRASCDARQRADAISAIEPGMPETGDEKSPGDCR